MKPVDQTRMYDPTHQQPPGNCWAACIASILEVSLDEVPDEAYFWRPGMHPRKSWPAYYESVMRWLAERNLTLVSVNVSNVLVDWTDCWEILSGPSPRDPKILHAVVGFAGKIAHDPHPSRAGLVEVEGQHWSREYFVTVDPSRRFQSR